MIQETNIKNHNAGVEHDPFKGPQIEWLIPCTESQIEILMACLLGGNEANLAYNQSNTLTFRGALRRDAMESALQTIVARHEALRSVFSIEKLQICIFKEQPPQLFYHDLSAENEPAKQEFVAGYITKESLHVFDLESGPLFRAGLIKLNEEEHCLILTAHHIICDGWSLKVILQDLSRVYSACVQNTVIDLPPPGSFSRFAQEQIKFLQSREYAEIENFWLHQYSKNIPVLNLPTDAARPQVRTYAAGYLEYELDNALVAAARKMGAAAGCSLVTTLLATFETLLYRLTGQESIVVGLPTAGQSGGNYNLVGHCVNLLPLRSDPSAGISFSDYLESRQAAVFDAYENLQLTFGSLLKKLKVSRDPSRIPLVPVVLNVDIGITKGIHFHGLTYQLKNNPRVAENFELFLNITESENNVTLECAYNAHLFKAGTIGLMMKRFEDVLKTVVADPSITLGGVKLVGQDGKAPAPVQQVQGDGPAIKYRNTPPLHELIHQVARQYPAKTALVFGEQELTYRQLDESSGRLALYLIEKGIKKGDFVGLALDRSAEMLITLLAIMKAGAAYIPLDPEYPAERISFILEDACAKMLITSKNARRQGSQAGNIFIEAALEESVLYTASLPPIPVFAWDLIYLLYTSGSTGKPKGVLIEHRSVVNFLYSMRRFPGFSAADILLAVTTISFDIAGLEMFLPLITGGTIVLAGAGATRNGEALAKLMAEEKVTVMQATPSTWRMMLSAGWKNREGIRMLIGGEAVKEEIKDALTSIGEVYNLYGPTETTIWSLAKKLALTEKVSIGAPIANTLVYIVDEQMQLVPAGESGEICIGGAGLARGYLNRPDITSQKFISNPFSDLPGSRIYRTGDIGRMLPDGNFECLGRIDDQVKIRGYRIELGEIENTLEALPGIREAVVVCRENQHGDARLVAYVVTENDSRSRQTARLKPAMGDTNNSANRAPAAQSSNWKKLMSLKLPGYMIPSHFELLPSLPLTPNGKIDRKALPEPSYDTGNTDLVFTQSYTGNEKFITDTWADLLNVKNIRLTDNFFDLGGHSLIAVEVMNRIEKHTGKKLPLSTLFQHSTVSTLASAMHGPAETHEWKSLVPIKAGGSKDPLYIIHGLDLDVLGFYNIAMYVDKDQPVYGIKLNAEERFNTMEEIAAFYISEMIQQNPAGPYALLGYSSGAIVAFEMARQLKAMNREIRMVGNIDYYLEMPRAKSILTPRMRKHTVEFFPRMLHVLRSLLLHPRYSLKFQKLYYKPHFLKMLSRLGLIRLQQQEETDREKLAAKKVIDDFKVALRKYSIQPLDICLDLFKAKVEVSYLEDRKFLGWKPVAREGVKVHKIPGDHFDLLLLPNCKDFARIVQAALDSKG